MNGLKSNIWKLQVIQVLRWCLFAIPTLVIFYESHGLSLQQIFLVQSAFSITALLLEVPTGYLADLAGRKLAMVMGLSIWALAWWLYSMGTSFMNFLNAEILLAVGSSLLSGADSALLYDTLAGLDKTEEYKKLESKQTVIWHFSEGGASILGAMLAVTSLALPFQVQAGVAMLAIPFAMSLTEAPRKILDTTTGKVRALSNVIKYALVDHKELRWLIIYNSVVSACCISVVWFMQPRFQAAGVPLKYFGLLWAATLFISGASAHFAPFIEEKLGKSTILKTLMPLLLISFLLFALLPPAWGLIASIVIYIIRGVNIPVFKDYVNKLVPAESRATTLSVSSMTMRLEFAVLGPLLGYLNDQMSFKTAFIFTACLLLIVYSISQFNLKKIYRV